MRKSEKISIKSPCSLTYEVFKTVNKDTKYCFACQKNIRDFSKQKDISNPTYCGLFTLSQLGTISNMKQLSNLLKPISLAAILGLSTTPLVAQEERYFGESLTKKQLEQTAFINGTLTDAKSGMPLPFIIVSAVIEDKTIFSTNSDSEGKFTLRIDTSQYDLTKLYIHFNNENYESDTILYSPLDKKIQIQLEANVTNVESPHIRSLGRVAEPDGWIYINGVREPDRELHKKAKRKSKRSKKN